MRCEVQASERPSLHPGRAAKFASGCDTHGAEFAAVLGMVPGHPGHVAACLGLPLDPGSAGGGAVGGAAGGCALADAAGADGAAGCADGGT
jgi:hypothetical protein